MQGQTQRLRLRTSDYRPDEHGEVTPREDERSSFLRRVAKDFERRKQAGELPEDVDSAHMLLAFFAMSSAPTILPQIVRRILGVDPDSEEFREAYAQNVARLVRHLAKPK